jgi:hypothetical protein
MNATQLLHIHFCTQKLRYVGDLEEKKSAAINGRISGRLRQRLDRISERYGPNDARMLEDALSALCDYVEAARKYESPMRMISADDTFSGVNEGPDDPVLRELLELKRMMADELRRRDEAAGAQRSEPQPKLQSPR